MKKYLTFFGILTVFCLMGITGYLDSEDKEAEFKLYCDNVRDKVWPDYQGTYKKFCLTQNK